MTVSLLEISMVSVALFAFGALCGLIIALEILDDNA